ncbi:MAG: hypothetical protein FJ368_04300 [Pelagibacterales bacterium]|nr:hypothetical protein [Pelagibacterales bacterium]
MKITNLLYIKNNEPLHNLVDCFEKLLLCFKTTCLNEKTFLRLENKNYMKKTLILFPLICCFFLSSCFDKSTEKRDKYRKLNKIALSYFKEKNFEKSLEYSSKALDLKYKDDDEFLTSNLLKAESLYKLHKFNESLEYFDKAYEVVKRRDDLRGMVANNEGDSMFFIAYSIAEEFYGDIEKAKEILLESLDYEENNFFIYTRLGFLEAIYFKNTKKSLEYFNKAKELDPVNFDLDPEDLIKKIKSSKDTYVNYLQKFL